MLLAVGVIGLVIILLGKDFALDIKLFEDVVQYPADLHRLKSLKGEPIDMEPLRFRLSDVGWDIVFDQLVPDCLGLVEIFLV
ncbi:unnamed protein product [marine sediment metagenome]|uniref:Uncharacterized protein n=1 Tax=marine sediment metagenome TaxID=412755 RepID=X1P8T2_9ZZZZ